MKKIFCLFIALCATCLAANEQGFQVTKRYPVPGNGGFDYIVLDGSSESSGGHKTLICPDRQIPARLVFWFVVVGAVVGPHAAVRQQLAIQLRGRSTGSALARQKMGVSAQRI